MLPGDLVKFKKPNAREIGQYYLVLEIDGPGWAKLDDGEINLFHHVKDLEVVSTGREE
jgi:hypothetical protein